MRLESGTGSDNSQVAVDLGKSSLLGARDVDGILIRLGWVEIRCVEKNIT